MQSDIVKQKEEKRLRAIKLLTLGQRAADIARILECSASSVERWGLIARTCGLDGLKEKSHDTWAARRKAKIYPQ